jgi:hypothetical protein
MFVTYSNGIVSEARPQTRRLLTCGDPVFFSACVNWLAAGSVYVRWQANPAAGRIAAAEH